VSRIGAAFAAAAGEERAALVPFLTAGWPDRDACLRLLVGLADAGADVIELGVPFSDPVADGPTIQRASQRALAGGTTFERALELAAAFRRERPTPLLLFTYLNPLLRRGVARAADELAAAGGDGVLVCDLPADEAPEVREEVRRRGLDVVALVAPTSRPERVASLAAASSGFVYLLARLGVTGAGGGAADLGPRVAAVRRVTPLPVAVGFGVADEEGARRAAALADGVVVGSALLDRIEAAGPEAGLAFARALRAALARPRRRF
jgi:tryptophan synthase alpha chain